MNDNVYHAYIAIIVFCLVAIALVVAFAPRVEAAEPDVPECEPINTAAVDGVGVITVFRCLPNEGPSYLLNSFGFMVVEE